MVRIYKYHTYNIYSNHEGGFIIHNTKKEFSEGHTHLNNFNTCKYLVKLAYHKSIPKNMGSLYLFESLIRISDNKAYINTLKMEVEKKTKKKGKSSK